MISESWGGGRVGGGGGGGGGARFDQITALALSIRTDRPEQTV